MRVLEMRRAAALLVALVVLSAGAALAVALLRDSARSPRTSSVRVYAVGDIARCIAQGDEQVASLLTDRPGTILALGDIAYPNGEPEDFARCFDPSWGHLKSRIRPVPGSHDYRTEDASGYFEYFGAQAGDPDRGYYSFDLGDWHLIALNSQCDDIEGGCEKGSLQYEWLRRDLEANSSRCTLAYWHTPRFSSGLHQNDEDLEEFFEVLYEFGAEMVLSGDDHDYERFAPQDDEANLDEAKGIRQFVVGTGGGILEGRGFREIQPNSEVRIAGTYGVLELTLHPDRYQWRFLEVGGEIGDSGQARCHS